MATVYISMGKVGAKGNMSNFDAWISGTLRSETVTSSASSAAGSLVGNGRDMAQVLCDTKVYVTAAATPVASAGNSIVCPAGQPTWVALQPGDKIAVLDA